MAKGSNSLTGRRSSSHNTKPYDANNSFVKKVATKVTDLIPQRSWISKWFNSSQGNGNVLDDTENTAEIESEEDIQKPPPLKKPRIRMDVIHPPGTFTIQPRVKSSINKADSSKMQYPIHNEMSEEFPEPGLAGPSGIGHLISSTPAIESDARNMATRRSESNSLVTTPNNGTTNGTDDNSESSESTSGCSSLIPQTNRQEAPTNASYNSPFPNKKRFMDDKLTFTNHLQSPRSLFLEGNSRDSLSSRRPSFNASIVTTTLDRASPLSSPFYSGNTTFGGANAAGLYKRNRSLFSNSNELQLKIPRRANVEVKPPSTSGIDSSGMSQTAKKILEALEHFSSPISDAKKIPLKNSNNTLTPIVKKKRLREDITAPSARVGLRHMMRELTVPTVPDILKLKRRQKLQDTTVAARKIVSARNEAPPPPQEYHIRTLADEDTKHRGKLKAKAKVNIEEEETVEAVNLPNIPLPISSLPNFNFIAPHSLNVTDQNMQKKEEVFTFASPIKMAGAAKSLQSINNFTFSSPIRAEGKPPSDNVNSTCTPLEKATEFTMPTVSSATTSVQNFIWSGSSTAPRPKEKAKNKDTNAGSMAPASELKTGSVMDILGVKPTTIDTSVSIATKSKTSTETNKDLPTCKENVKDNIISKNTAESTSSTSETSSTVWECAECLTKNNINKSECFVCKASKPTHKNKNVSDLCTSDSATRSKPMINDCFGSQFKLSSNQWECTSCCVRNKQTDVKCVACTTPKPCDKGEGTSDTAKIANPDLSNKFKYVEGSWECVSCKMKNSSTATICSYCSTVKPASSKFSSPIVDKNKDCESAGTNRNPDTPASTDIAEQSSSSNLADTSKASATSYWECPCCLVRIASTVDSCPCCKTAKPTAPATSSKKTQSLPVNGFGNKFKKPEGAWNCSSCMLQNDAKAVECVACTTPKPGTTKESTTNNTSTFTNTLCFGVPPSTVPFKFGIDKADQKPESSSSTSGFKFGDNQMKKPDQFIFGTQKEEKKELNDTSKNESADIAASKPLGTGFVFQANTDSSGKADASQDVQKIDKKPGFSFVGLTTAVTPLSTEKENISTTTFTSPSVATFTFGVGKPVVKETSVNKEKPNSDAPVTSMQSTASASFTDTSTKAATTPAVQSNPQELKMSTNFQFSVANNTTVSDSSATNTATTSLTSSVQSSFIFSESKSVAEKTLPTFVQASASTPANTISSAFVIGETKTAETGANSLNKNPLTLPSSSTKPVFPNMSTTPSLFSNDKTKPISAFTTEESKQPSFDTSESKPVTFGLSENKPSTFGSAESKPTIFGAPETKIPVFDSTKKPTPVFNSTPQATAAVATPAFGATATKPSFFGSNPPVFPTNTPSTFGTGTTSSIFPTTKSNEPNAANSNLFTFGSTPGQTVTQGSGFNFSKNTKPEEAAQKPSLFTFGNNTSTLQSNNLFGGGTFNNPAPASTSGFTFNAPKLETPAFGQSTVAIPLFGATQSSTPNQPTPSFTSTPSSSAGFNFEPMPPTTTSGGFNFGGMPSNPAPTGGFNFNPPSTTSTGGFNFNPPNTTPTFDPNITPTYDFTRGEAPSVFNATPQALKHRKIKKAIRRRN